MIQIEPPPIPTLTKSAPASAKKLNPSSSTTLPAPHLTLFLYVFLIQAKVSFCQSEKPSLESIHNKSAPASISAGTLSL